MSKIYTSTAENHEHILDELRRAGTRRCGRPIAWPTPHVLKKGDPVQHAEMQISKGYVADVGFEPIRIESNFDWSANPFRSRPWRTRLMCLQPMDAFLYAYDKTGDQTWLSRALDVLFDWCGFHQQKQPRSWRAWADMPAGYRAIKLSYVIDMLIEGRWQPGLGQDRQLIWAIDRHLEILTRPSELSEGNHGIFQLHGLKILATVAWNFERSTGALEFVAEHFPRLVRNQFSTEGVHLEHSPHYHWWMQAELDSIARSGWHDPQLVEWVLEVCSRAESAKHWLRGPDGSMIRVGDTANSEPTEPPDAPDCADIGTDHYRMRTFATGGYAVCKSEASTLFFQCAYHSKSHKHQDDLHFDLHDLGKPILVDAGSCGYKTSPERRYVISTRAHNTVQLDNKDYPRDGTDRYGSALKLTQAFENGVRFVAEVDHHSLGATHKRQIDFIPGSGLICFDEVSSHQACVMTQWFHLAPCWEYEGDTNDTLRFSDGDTELFISSSGVKNTRIHFGEKVPQLLGWRTISKKLVPAWSIGFQKDGEAVVFHTLIRYGNDSIHLGEHLRDVWRAC
jgi:hypothetical protein